MNGLALPGRQAELLRQRDIRIIVTGAGGWIGRATLEILAEALGLDGFRRNVVALASSERRLQLQTGLDVRLGALEELDSLAPTPSLLLHFAFLGREKVAEIPAERYVALNADITQRLRRAVARLRPMGMFLASSGAVYRPDGAIDTDLARNPYGALKYVDEVAFAEACGATNTPLVVARIFNLAGAYINKLDGYALASFLIDAREDRPISIRAPRIVERSYVQVGDVVNLAVAAVLEPNQPYVRFDTAGERIVELGELARLAREVAGRPQLEIHRPALDPKLPADRYVGDPAVMRSLAGRHGVSFESLERQILRTAEYLAAIRP